VTQLTEREAKHMQHTRLNESADYSARRQELQEAEIALMLQRETVASLRRSLPADTPVDDYAFSEGPRNLADGDATVTALRLSQLFTSPSRTLVIYQLMYGKAQTSPCPMCTMWIDGFNSIAEHITRNVDFAVAAAADPVELRAHARSRGWDRLRLLSCGESRFKYDLGSEEADGSQESAISVFTLGDDGSPRHFYTTYPAMSEEINQRGIDLLSPVWHLLDLTPDGRGDWYPSLDY
jgi:predicted dithiol-disulfide oxidoreductase (DUF899 family)